LVKNKVDLPDKRGNIKKFIDITFPDESSDSRKLAEAAFGHLQK
jgi:hypothetical protein